MGSLISMFKKKPTTLEQLKKIEDNLKRIEDYKRITEQKQKRTVANVIVYGAALYVLACVIVFVWYLPESWAVRIGLLVPFITIPLILYGLKRLISWYFNSKMVKANKEYEDLQRKKKSIIDNVMETETFNKAKEILSKYAPEKLDKKEKPTVPVSLSIAMQKPSTGPVLSLSDLRQRNSVVTTIAPSQTRYPSMVEKNVQFPRQSQSLYRPSMSPLKMLPQPLFKRQLNFTDKLVEYIIGDGPSYRYALICRHCSGHNGMALKEEFPFLAYTCCYCMKYNPARSQRPQAPRLPEAIAPMALPASNAETTSGVTATEEGPEESRAQIISSEEQGKQETEDELSSDNNHDDHLVDLDPIPVLPVQSVENVYDPEEEVSSTDVPPVNEETKNKKENRTGDLENCFLENSKGKEKTDIQDAESSSQSSDTRD